MRFPVPNSVRRGSIWFSHEGRGPHISLVFREMGDFTDADRSVRRIESERVGAVVSHISEQGRDAPNFLFVPLDRRRGRLSVRKGA